MIAAVAEAERYLARKRRPKPKPSSAADAGARRALRLELSPILRGALGRLARGTRFILDWRDSPEVLEFVNAEWAPAVAARGCITPDHSIRTKPFPAWLSGDLFAPNASRETLQARSDAALQSFSAAYADYFSQNAAQKSPPPQRLDLLPRIVAVPGLGIVALGRNAVQAKVAADLYEQAISVMLQAESVGSFRPVSLPELFDVEYWSLEQAKLGVRSAEPPLAGQIALITGAASGIGRATSAHFLELGAHVLMVDRDAGALSRAHAELASKAPPRLRTFVADLTDPAQASAAVDAAILAFGGLDLVVSNAGNAPSGALHERAGESLLRASLEINLLSHQHVSQQAAQALIRQGLGGCLCFNASKSAFNPGPLFGPYAVAKSALVALMKQYAIDLAPHGIRANAVNADRVRTGLFSPELIETRARARGLSPDAYFSSNLLARETLAEDVAQAFAYLATARATTGAVIPVDGGNAAAFPR
jgi:NAD(P)-dependent dehydrogenase (short-subunit alcohol dehydrogenase family)